MANEDKWQGASEQAQAQFESIKEMVEALEATENGGTDWEQAQIAIHEDALSVETRGDWTPVGSQQVDRPSTPTEYRILLCTGGPAVQITGELNEHGEPETARLMMADWGLVWTEYRPVLGMLSESSQEILLTYARQFYFAE